MNKVLNNGWRHTCKVGLGGMLARVMLVSVWVKVFHERGAPFDAHSQSNCRLLLSPSRFFARAEMQLEVRGQNVMRRFHSSTNYESPDFEYH